MEVSSAALQNLSQRLWTHKLSIDRNNALMYAQGLYAAGQLDDQQYSRLLSFIANTKSDLPLEEVADRATTLRNNKVR